MLSSENCASLIEAFTEKEILRHVESLDTGLHVSQDRLHRFEAEEKDRMECEEACSLCGISTRTFEPIKYYCNGARCKGKLIGRGRCVYYATGSNQWHWCRRCYNDLKDGEVIVLEEDGLRKSHLKMKKNDEQAEEPWVQCDKCERWVHQICALFNSRKNSQESASYYCPHCVLTNRQQAGNMAPTALKLGGKDLPCGPLSNHIETKVKERLQMAYEEEASQTGVSIDKVEKVNNLYIREVSVMDTKHFVKPGFQRRYGAGGNYPADFPVRSKCIVLFQDLDGVDVLLFGMYVHEYGHTCPSPNQRRVYISYMDSVHYFRPKKYRTMVYHEILISYLEEVKSRGFHTAHIWACPPAKDEDYLLYCHPRDQRTPKNDRLRQWYLTMLEQAQKRGIVEGLTNLYDEYWSNPKTADACSLPYLEGDYWIGEAETIIKDLPEGTPLRYLPKATTDGSGLLLKEEGPGTDFNSSTSSKLLLSSRAGGGSAAGAGATWACSRSNSLVPTMKDDEVGIGMGAGLGSKTAIEGNVPAGSRATLKKRKAGDRIKKKAKKAKSAAIPESRGTRSRVKRGVKEEAPIIGDPLMNKLGAVIAPIKSSFIVAHLRSREFVKAMQDRRAQEEAIESAKKAVKTAQSEGREPTPEETKLASQPIEKDETEERQSSLECEVLSTRDTFLHLCQGNSYLFDTLRRAKYSSMMVLDHLLNPDEPKFRETCPDVDPSKDCYQIQSHTVKPVSDRPSSTHKAHLSPDKRQKYIEDHLNLLQHSSSCSEKSCSKKNCSRIKNLLMHVSMCPIKVRSGCTVCKRVWAFLQVHARRCKNDRCTVPKCRELRRHLKDQQKTDNRRRMAMSECSCHRRAGIIR